MKLFMKQKVFSWTDRFAIWDEREQNRYYVEGEFLSWGKKLHIFDLNQREVAFVRQKVWAFMPRFFIEIDGREVFQIVKRFTFFKQKYELEGLNWHVEGDFWAHDYAVFDGSRLVMRLSKHWFTWGDSYELDVINPEEELLCLCIVLAIDAAIEAEGTASTAGSSST